MEDAAIFAARPLICTASLTTPCSLLEPLRETVRLELSARKKLPPEEFQCCFLSDKERTVIYLISLGPWMLNHNSVNPHSWPIWFLFPGP